ncbi:MAG: DUF924 family protein [Amaricoccus sp.]|uniref:DUF924 family protein n=1 Tax=Amaricoccus sp. TaxID=1872485 RepID=UPI0039E57651
MDPRAEEILEFWTSIGPKGWYEVDDAVDREITERWGTLWESARAGGLHEWRAVARSCLALTVLLDQFPRNMFRGDARAFASDAHARAVARDAIAAGFDKATPVPERQFFYLPLMHSEVSSDQDQCVRLVLLNLGRGGTLDRARAHRAVIRRFGRFPYRNDALGRSSTPEEAAFLDAGGYRSALEAAA